MDLQRKGNVKGDEKTSKEFISSSRAQRFVCGAQPINLSDEQEEHAQHLLQEGFDYIQALAKLEIRLRSLRGPNLRTKQSAAVRQRGSSTAQLRKDGTWRQSVTNILTNMLRSLGSYCPRKGRTRSSVELLEDRRRRQIGTRRRC